MRWKYVLERKLGKCELDKQEWKIKKVLKISIQMQTFHWALQNIQFSEQVLQLFAHQNNTNPFQFFNWLIVGCTISKKKSHDSLKSDTFDLLCLWERKIVWVRAKFTEAIAEH